MTPLTQTLLTRSTHTSECSRIGANINREDFSTTPAYLQTGKPTPEKCGRGFILRFVTYVARGVRVEERPALGAYTSHRWLRRAHAGSHSTTVSAPGSTPGLSLHMLVSQGASQLAWGEGTTPIVVSVDYWGYISPAS